MSQRLLQTKLFAPAPGPELVPRPHLSAKLDGALERKMTLVSAPAGYGKTTLVVSWLDGKEHAWGWLSLDESDNDPARFLAYFIAALQKAEVECGEAAMTLLQSPQPSFREALVALVNDLATGEEPLLLILDDYHVIHDPGVHELVAFFLDHAPPQIHLFVLTRVDPPLPVSRLRARRQLVEVRQQDLRFRTAEAATFLTGRNNLALTPAQVAALETRTEGWIAGLQMAALALQGHDDSEDFVERFAGSHYYIMDYLADEVLARRPPGTRDFLLQTSILDRLAAPLCDEVTGRHDSRQLLEELDRTNLFLIPLDGVRRWYRYHHLFAHLLQQRLQQKSPDVVIALHRRAARWYREHDLAPEAIGHLLAAGEFAEAADLMIAIADQFVGRGEHATLAGWLDALPQAVRASRPRLALIQAWGMQSEGQFDVLEAHLAALEQSVAAIDDAAEREILQGRIAVHRANRLMSVAFRPAAVMAQEALTLLPEHERFHRGVAYLILGNAGRYLGDVSTARPALEQAAAICQEGGDMIGAIIATHALAQLYESQGKLHLAAKLLAAALPAAGHTIQMAGILHLGLAEVHYHWNELDEALRHLERGQALTGNLGYRHEALLGYLTLARIRLAQGDGDGAWTAIRTGEEYCSNAGISSNPHLERFKAHLHFREGNRRAADHWAENHTLLAPGENQPMHLAEQILLAQIYLAQGRTGAAATLLEAQREAAVQDKRAGDLVTILALLAIVRATQGAERQALVTLEEALHLGGSGRFIRSFVDYGEPMAQLLRTAAAKGIALDYVTRLLAAFTVAEELGLEAEALVEPLSERELEVLRLIAAGLTNREIAEQLIVAHGTAKRHVSNIYGKLDVGNRTQAVARGRELGLL